MEGNCKSRMAIVLLSCMSEDRESFSCHINYFVIINCIISPVRLFFSLSFRLFHEIERTEFFFYALILVLFLFFVLHFGVSQERHTILPHNVPSTISIAILYIERDGVNL